MSNNTVRTDYDAMGQAANSFNQEADRISRIAQNLCRAEDSLRCSNWIGQGAQSFFLEMDSSVLPAFGRLERALQETSRVLNKISQIFHTGEQDGVAIVGRLRQAAGNGGSGAQAGQSGGGQFAADSGLQGRMGKFAPAAASIGAGQFAADSGLQGRMGKFAPAAASIGGDLFAADSGLQGRMGKYAPAASSGGGQFAADNGLQGQVLKSGGGGSQVSDDWTQRGQTAAASSGGGQFAADSGLQGRMGKYAPADSGLQGQMLKSSEGGGFPDPKGLSSTDGGITAGAQVGGIEWVPAGQGGQVNVASSGGGQFTPASATGAGFGGPKGVAATDGGITAGAQVGGAGGASQVSTTPSAKMGGPAADNDLSGKKAAGGGV